MKLEKLRAYLLEVGDEFLMFGSRYKVTAVTKISIRYVGVYGSYTKNAYSFGVNSRQRIMLIIKPHKNDRQENTYSTFSGIDYSGLVQATPGTKSTSTETTQRKHQSASEGDAGRCRRCEPVTQILNRAPAVYRSY